MPLSPAVMNILNDSNRLARLEADFALLSRVYDGSADAPVFVSGLLGSPADPMLIYNNPEAWVEESLEDLACKLSNAKEGETVRPPCIESAIYGVHFVDSLFGAEVFFKDDQWYNKYLSAPVGALQAPDLETCKAWEIARRAALHFIKIAPPLPLFGLPTLSSALNIAVNLYGEEILAQMLMDPDAAQHDLQIINDTICDLHRWYRAHLPAQRLQPVISWSRTQPPSFGQLCGCTTQLISQRLYDQFIAPLDDALLAVYPNGGMIHLCGRHTQLIDSFRKMPHLRSLQLNDRAAEDLAIYREQLRPDQVIYLRPCPGMTTQQAIAIAGGSRLVIMGRSPDGR